MGITALGVRMSAVIASAASLIAGGAAPPSVGAARAPAASSVALDAGLRDSSGAAVRVIVAGMPGHARAIAGAVARVGGRVGRELPIVDGVAATVPRSALAALAVTPGVTALSLDRRMRTQGDGDPAGSRSAYQDVIRADEARAAGLTGRGTTVALIDTGVANVPDLAGGVVPVVDERTGTTSRCQNFSGESGCGDSYGHGTFLAGLIAGSGSGGTSTGVAPEARVLSVKVAGRDGATDVSTVLAAIQWVVSFRDRYGIRVLNLSLGTDSTQSYRVDPLNYAVERAWAEGIVVVVSAANRGPAAGTVTKPGDDPFVVTVGAVDDRGTPGLGDDRLPDFSSRGPTPDGFVKPDVVAPGTHLVSLRSPGSLIDEIYPPSTEGPYRKGSGTSMSAAVVSGVAALMLQARPDARPDEVKHALRTTARPVAADDANAVGSGLVDAYAAALEAPTGRANAGLARSNGLGSLGDSRGSLDLAASTLPETLLTARLTAQLLLWDPLGYTVGAWSAPTWYTSAHGLVAWQDTEWTGDNWGGDNWGGSSWYGVGDDADVYGRPGPASAWYGAWE